MAKLILMKKNEISVPEEKKGKQIAVKENNIVALHEFYKNNYIKTEEEPKMDSLPEQKEEILEQEQLFPGTPIQPGNANETLDNSIMEEPVIPSNFDIESTAPAIENGISVSSNGTNEEQAINLTLEENNGAKGEQTINLILEENQLDQSKSEELDPELKEIKERLDKVIEDLNNYKKKIKLLETEVNQNLEKSREVLKDTQAAAKIMSIQQERQREINDEINSGSTIVNDSSRTLQMNTAA